MAPPPLPPSLQLLQQLMAQKPIQSVRFLSSGMCNDAWLLTTTNGDAYLVKTAQPEPEETEQNDLLTEARLLQALQAKTPPGFPIPNVAFVSARPMLYGYPYLPGEWMKNKWEVLSEEARQNFCVQLAQFHARLHSLLTEPECRALHLAIDLEAQLAEENEADLAAVLAIKSLPYAFRQFAGLCAETLPATTNYITYAFCHNDSHHENILVHQGQLAGVVDFGDADYGDIHREFGRYALDYPAYFESIVSTYEQLTNKRLSRKRIIARAFLESLEETAVRWEETGELDTVTTCTGLWQRY